MPRYTYTEKFVKFKGATGESARIAKSTRKELNRLTRKANRIRKDMLLKMYAEDPRSNIISFEAYIKDAEESGYIPSKKSAALTKFRNAKDVQQAIKELTKFTKDPMKYRSSTFKTFIIGRIIDYGGSHEKSGDVIDMIIGLTGKQLVRLHQRYPDLTPYLTPSEQANPEIVDNWITSIESKISMFMKENANE